MTKWGDQYGQPRNAPAGPSGIVGVADAAEPAACDGEGVHDACQAALAAIEDCNGNGLGDDCEKELEVNVASGRHATTGWGPCVQRRRDPAQRCGGRSEAVP